MSKKKKNILVQTCYIIDNDGVSNNIEIMLILMAIKFHFRGSYYQQNLTLMVMLKKFVKLIKGSFLIFHKE